MYRDHFQPQRRQRTEATDLIKQSSSALRPTHEVPMFEELMCLTYRQSGATVVTLPIQRTSDFHPRPLHQLLAQKLPQNPVRHCQFP